MKRIDAFVDTSIRVMVPSTPPTTRASHEVSGAFTLGDVPRLSRIGIAFGNVPGLSRVGIAFGDVPRLS